MKKLGITLLAAAFCLPLTFAATQGQSSTAAGQTDSSKPAKTKKMKSNKKGHKKHGSDTQTPPPANQ